MTAASSTWQSRPITLCAPIRAPVLTTAPASMKHGASIVDAIVDAGLRRHDTRSPAASGNGGATNRPSMMSTCAWRYFAGVPMSIQ